MFKNTPIFKQTISSCKQSSIWRNRIVQYRDKLIMLLVYRNDKSRRKNLVWQLARSAFGTTADFRSMGAKQLLLTEERVNTLADKLNNSTKLEAIITAELNRISDLIIKCNL